MISYGAKKGADHKTIRSFEKCSVSKQNFSKNGWDIIKMPAIHPEKTLEMLFTFTFYQL